MFKAKIIYTSPKRKIFVRIRDVSLTFILIFSMVFRKNEILLFFERMFGETVGAIVLLIFLFSLLGLITFYFLSRRKKQTGELTLTEEVLNIQDKKEALQINIKQLKNFTIKTNIFIPNEEYVGLYSSYNNWLIFEYMNTKYIYQFIIESYFKGNQFKELVDYWKKNHSFTLIEEK